MRSFLTAFKNGATPVGVAFCSSNIRRIGLLMEDVMRLLAHHKA
jgi:hypothetical protein